MADDEFSIRIRGIDDVTRALFQISPKLAERVVMLSIRKGANYMKKAISAAAPSSKHGSREYTQKAQWAMINGKRKKVAPGVSTILPPGRIKRSIRVVTSKRNKYKLNGTVGLFISCYPGKSRTDKKGAWYGSFVDKGYNLGSRQISAREAISLGIVTEGQHLQSVVNAQLDSIAQRSRTGKKSRARRIRYRNSGSRHIDGQNFIKKGFDSASKRTLEIMVQALEVSTEQLLRQLNLNVTR